MLRRNRNTSILPKVKNTPLINMGEYTWLIYGTPKIGKTSLSAQFPKNLLIALEPGYKSLEVFAIDVPMNNGWDKLNEIKNELINKDTMFKTVSLDTGNIIYDICLDQVCKDFKVKHPSDVSWGKAWKAISDNFKKFHLDIISNNYGLVVLAHERTKEIKDLNGITIDQISPAFSGGAEDFYSRIIDNIFYYHYVNNKRFLLIRGNEEIIAGTRLTNNFLTPSGEKIYQIPMGNCAKEGYKNLVDGFNNKQIKTFKNIEKESEVKITRNRNRNRNRNN